MSRYRLHPLDRFALNAAVFLAALVAIDNIFPNAELIASALFN